MQFVSISHFGIHLTLLAARHVLCHVLVHSFSPLLLLDLSEREAIPRPGEFTPMCVVFDESALWYAPTIPTTKVLETDFE